LGFFFENDPNVKSDNKALPRLQSACSSVFDFQPAKPSPPTLVSCILGLNSLKLIVRILKNGGYSLGKYD